MPQPNIGTADKTFRSAELICGALVIALGSLAALGWTFNAPILAGFARGYIPMAPLTAIMFLLIATAVLSYTSLPSAKIRKISSAGAAVIFWIFILAKIIEFSSSVRFGIESLLVRNPEKFGLVLSARISPITLVAFLLAGTSITLLLLFGDRNGTANAAGAVGLALFMLSAVLLLGYLYGAPLLYGGKIIPVALTTSLAFLFLSMALILTAGRSHFPLRAFVGGSAGPLLLRAFLPLIILIVLTHELIVKFVHVYIKAPLPFEVAVEALFFSLVVGIVIIQTAKVIGGRMDRASSEQKKAEDKVEHLAFYNSLTDLPNRTFLDSLLAKAISQAKRDNEKIAVFFLDLDNYKNVKNTLGYDFADKLLIKIAGQFKAKNLDNAIGAIGEDEYLFFLPIQSPQDAAGHAKKILNLFTKPWLVDGQQVIITANIGIAIFPEDSDRVELLERHADSAMTAAKEEGENNYKFFEKRMAISKAKTSERLVLAVSLTDAIRNRELTVYYQPIINVKIGEIIGAESLVRWQKPGNRLVMPGEFIGLAESTGQIMAIDNMVLKTACEQSEKWRSMGFPGLKTTVNFSAKHFAEERLVREICEEQEGAIKDIVLEVTESDIMKNPELAIKQMNRLRESGYLISVDDFGTGYASLSYLKNFPVDFLKIDKSFIDNIATSRKDQAIVAASIEMAHGLGLFVIAEGVETEQQFALLRRLDCDGVQGFLFSKPLPTEEFERFLAEDKHWKAA